MRRALLTTIAAGAGMMTTGAAYADSDDRSYRVPDGHLPPPGECRVWYPDLPPGQQQPTDSRSARREACREGGRVIYGGREGRDER